MSEILIVIGVVVVLLSALMWWGLKDNGPALKRRGKTCSKVLGGTCREEEVMPVLVRVVHPDVASAQVKRLVELTDDSDVLCALMLVLASMETGLIKLAMREADAQAVMLARAHGVAMVVGELEALRKGVDGQFVKFEKEVEGGK